MAEPASDTVPMWYAGEIEDVPLANVRTAEADGYRVATDSDIKDWDEVQHFNKTASPAMKGYTGLITGAETALAGVAGLAEPVTGATGAEAVAKLTSALTGDTEEESARFMRLRAQEFEGSALAGEVVGQVAPMLATGGVVGGLGTGARLTAYGAEAAATNLAARRNEAFLEDREMAASETSSAIIIPFLFGAGIPGAGILGRKAFGAAAKGVGGTRAGARLREFAEPRARRMAVGGRAGDVTPGDDEILRRLADTDSISRPGETILGGVKSKSKARANIRQELDDVNLRMGEDSTLRTQQYDTAVSGLREGGEAAKKALATERGEGLAVLTARQADDIATIDARNAAANAAVKARASAGKIAKGKGAERLKSLQAGEKAERLAMQPLRKEGLSTIRAATATSLKEMKDKALIKKLPQVQALNEERSLAVRSWNDRYKTIATKEGHHPNRRKATRAKHRKEINDTYDARVAEAVRTEETARRARGISAETEFTSTFDEMMQGGMAAEVRAARAGGTADEMAATRELEGLRSRRDAIASEAKLAKRDMVPQQKTARKVFNDETKLQEKTRRNAQREEEFQLKKSLDAPGQLQQRHDDLTAALKMGTSEASMMGRMIGGAGVLTGDPTFLAYGAIRLALSEYGPSVAVGAMNSQRSLLTEASQKISQSLLGRTAATKWLRKNLPEVAPPLSGVALANWFDDSTAQLDAMQADAAATSQRIQEATTGMEEVDPGIIAEGVAHTARTIEYLQGMRPNSGPQFQLMPNGPSHRPSEMEMKKFHRIYAAAVNPWLLFREIDTRMLHAETVNAVRELYPGYFHTLQASLGGAMSQATKVPSFRERIVIDHIMGGAGMALPAMNGGFQLRQQGYFQQQQAQQPPPPQGGPGKPTGTSSIAQDMKTNSQRVSESIGN